MDDLDVFLKSLLLMMIHGFIIMIQKQKSNRKCTFLKMDIRPRKVWQNKSAGKRMATIFFMKSGLVKSISLEFGVSISIYWYDNKCNKCLSQIFAVTSQR